SPMVFGRLTADGWTPTTTSRCLPTWRAAKRCWISSPDTCTHVRCTRHADTAPHFGVQAFPWVREGCLQEQRRGVYDASSRPTRGRHRREPRGPDDGAGARRAL